MSAAERLLTSNWAECSEAGPAHYSVGFKPATRVVVEEERGIKVGSWQFCFM